MHRPNIMGRRILRNVFLEFVFIVVVVRVGPFFYLIDQAHSQLPPKIIYYILSSIWLEKSTPSGEKNGGTNTYLTIFPS